MDIDAIIEANGNLFKTSFPGTNVALTYRLLSIKEYKIFRSLRDGGVLPPFLVSEMVFNRCYIGAPSAIPDTIHAGVTVSIGDLILYLSGDCDQETLKQDLMGARQLYPADSVHEYMRAAIITAFPVYTIEIMDSWTRREMLLNFTIAENILSKQNPEYQRIDIDDIKSGAEIAAAAAAPKNNDINFARENAQVRKALGAWNEEEARPSQGLSPEQLRRLSEFRNG